MAHHKTPYLEKNKEKGGESRPEDQKIWNRTSKKYESVRIKIRLIEDSSKDHNVLIRFQITPNIEAILRELSQELGENLNVMMNAKRKPINSIKEIVTGKVYYVGNVAQPNGDKYLSKEEQQKFDEDLQQKDAEFWEKDEEVRKKHKEKLVFENGRGIETRQLVLTGRQQERGLSWLLEQASKLFNINGVKLYTLGRGRVRDLCELIQRGAYILVPLSESLNDSIFYYLPDKAVDTSSTLDEEPSAPARTSNKNKQKRKSPARSKKRNSKKRSASAPSQKRSPQSLSVKADSRTESQQNSPIGSKGKSKSPDVDSLASVDLPDFDDIY